MAPQHNISNMTMTTERDDCQLGTCTQSESIPPPTKYVLLCAGSIIFILNVPAIVTVFFTKVKSSNFVYLHILSLSLTDAGVGLTLVCSAVFQFHNETRKDYWSCWSRLFVTSIMSTSSVFQVTMISLDRLLLFRSVAWKSITKSLTLLFKIIIGIFFLVVIMNAIPFLTLTTSGSISDCTIQYLFTGKGRSFSLYYGIWAVFVLVINGILTCKNLRILWNHKKRMQRVNTGVNPISTKETRGMITLTLIAFLQIVLATPIYMYFLVHGISGEDIVPGTYLPLMSLGCLCSACNPVVYSFRIPEMREALKVMRRKIC